MRSSWRQTTLLVLIISYVLEYQAGPPSLTLNICPFFKVTPVVPLSNDSWSMSFAKYLELRFYGHQYTRRANAEPCGHSIHKDYHQYFSYNQMVASFRLVGCQRVLCPSLSPPGLS